MKTIFGLLLFLVSTGCSVPVVMDAQMSDTGMAMEDMGDMGIMAMEDAHIVNDAGTPLQCTFPIDTDISLSVQSSDCTGPFETAQVFYGTMRDDCIIAPAFLTVSCHHSRTDIRLYGGLVRREGLVYSTGRQYIDQCEGVGYLCELTVHAVTGETRLSCSLDNGTSWCTIQFNR